MANYLRKPWIASIVKEDLSNAFRIGADGPPRKGHPLQVIEVREDDEVTSPILAVPSIHKHTYTHISPDKLQQKWVTFRYCVG